MTKLPRLSELVATLVLFAALLPTAAAQDLDPAGTWEGDLVIPQGTLRVVFHISAADSGYTATMDSPDQGAAGIPVSSVAIDGDSIVLQVAAVAGRYEGTANESGTIEGTWTQGPASLDLRLERKADETENKSDADGSEGSASADELPYHIENVHFINDQESIRLAGTLTVPEGDGPFPAVLLVSGSGPQDRDETIVGHKPFRVIADHLTRNGIAVLRYDDRGYGQSEGNFGTATISSFADDAESGFRYLMNREEINPRLVGMIGHSEGGVVAPMVAARTSDLAFIVMLAGPALPGSEILLMQAELIMEASGIESANIAANAALQKGIFEILESDLHDQALEDALREFLSVRIDSMTDEEKTALGVTEETIDIQIQTLVSPWFRHFVSYDPAPALSSVDCPVLALFGEKDLQVPADANIAALQEIADASPNIEIKKLQGLNHLFQTAETGSPAEYQSIQETISPVVLDEISSWIGRVVTQKPVIG